MTLLPAGVKVHLAFGYIDMRKSINGLAMLVQDVLRQDPFSGHLFVFRGRKANLIKIVFWDGTGLCLFTKRLEHGVFLRPSNVDPGGTLMLNSAQLSMLIDGVDCGGKLHLIGETVSEMLDHVPARLRVIRICRPRYGCRACGTIHQAPAPERPIAKGLASPALLAHVLIAKYCDYLPLYRQSQIFARQGVEIDRSTLANWVGSACWWLEPLQARLAAHVFGSAKLFADDTPIPVLDPGRGRTKTGRLWVYTRDDRPWSGPEPPAAVYFYSPDRKAERPAAHLQDFRGVLQVDGYAGFERLTTPGDIVLAACWAHARRKFYDLHEATGSPIAAEAMRRIAELYAIERSIRGRSAEERRHVVIPAPGHSSR